MVVAGTDRRWWRLLVAGTAQKSWWLEAADLAQSSNGECKTTQQANEVGFHSHINKGM